MTTTDVNGYTPPDTRLTPARTATYGANLTTRTGLTPDITEKIVTQLQNDALAHALNATSYVLEAAEEALQKRYDELIAAIQAMPTTMRMVNRDRVVDLVRRSRPMPLPKGGRA